MHIMLNTHGMVEFTVKAREHQGTKSLDLTIPAKIVEEANISPGDIFKIQVSKDENTLNIQYIRVYSKK